MKKWTIGFVILLFEDIFYRARPFCSWSMSDQGVYRAPNDSANFRREPATVLIGPDASMSTAVHAIKARGKKKRNECDSLPVTGQQAKLLISCRLERGGRFH
ncbi:hypothetical protein [Novosphingobium naphthalenivorans]|uniref:hypothetical protein n=1 Tax=Novosphingobium naphthalenivorans TaxID=273168 RepID=UPI0012EE2D29|nr:hypothetical protein [Novosphingobium naphthalenivorans]